MNQKGPPGGGPKVMNQSRNESYLMKNVRLSL